MREAKTKHLWRSSQAFRGNPTSCLRQEVMRVIGDRVHREMSDSRSGLATLQKCLHHCSTNSQINGWSVPLSLSGTHTNTLSGSDYWLIKLPWRTGNNTEWERNLSEPKRINELCLCGRQYPCLVWFVYNIWILCLAHRSAFSLLANWFNVINILLPSQFTRANGSIWPGAYLQSYHSNITALLQYTSCTCGVQENPSPCLPSERNLTCFHSTGRSNFVHIRRCSRERSLVCGRTWKRAHRGWAYKRPRTVSQSSLQERQTNKNWIQA